MGQLERFDGLVEECADVIFNVLTSLAIATRIVAYSAHMTAAAFFKASGIK